jgi:hypothetical protein
VRAHTCSHRSPAFAARAARADRFTFVAPNELCVPTSDASFPADPRDAPHRVATRRVVRVVRRCDRHTMVRCDAVRCGAVRCGAVRCGAVRMWRSPTAKKPELHSHCSASPDGESRTSCTSAHQCAPCATGLPAAVRRIGYSGRKRSSAPSDADGRAVRPEGRQPCPCVSTPASTPLSTPASTLQSAARGQPCTECRMNEWCERQRHVARVQAAPSRRTSEGFG